VSLSDHASAQYREFDSPRHIQPSKIYLLLTC
jgi:hypothetical protein